MPENSATAKYGENIPGANTIFHKSCWAIITNKEKQLNQQSNGN